jgi:TnpA family transposase
MPRRSIFSITERKSLFDIPESQDDLIRLYTLSDADLALIRQHRGAQNRLGFAVQLCYMRYPGILLAANAAPFDPLLNIVSEQLKVSKFKHQTT